jgi:hypothetical protein
MNISATLQSRQATYATALTALERAIESGESGAALDQRIDALGVLRADLDQLARAEQAAQGRLVEVGRGRGAPPNKALPYSVRLARLGLARCFVQFQKRPLDVVVRQLFPDEEGESGTLAIARSAVAAADATTAGWATELVRSEVKGMLQTDLAPISIAAALAVRGVTLPFGGAPSVLIPSVSARGIAMAGAWVGEGAVIPVLKGTINAFRAQRCKLAGITTLTKELRRTSNPDAVEVLR